MINIITIWKKIKCLAVRVKALEDEPNLDEQTLSTTEVLGVTTEITISNGNTVPINHPAGSSVIPSNIIPIPDNEIDTAIRTGQIGTSLDYARSDHNHPIRRQIAPAYPTVTAGGPGIVITNTYNNGFTTDEESVTFKMTFRVTQIANNAWNYLKIPNIAGFQTAEIYVAGVYHQSGNLNGIPNAPLMYNFATNYFNGNIVYVGEFRRNQNVIRYVSLKIKYTRL